MVLEFIDNLHPAWIVAFFLAFTAVALLLHKWQEPTGVETADNRANPGVLVLGLAVGLGALAAWLLVGG